MSDYYEENLSEEDIGEDLQMDSFNVFNLEVHEMDIKQIH